MATHLSPVPWDHERSKDLTSRLGALQDTRGVLAGQPWHLPTHSRPQYSGFVSPRSCWRRVRGQDRAVGSDCSRHGSCLGSMVPSQPHHLILTLFLQLHLSCKRPQHHRAEDGVAVDGLEDVPLPVDLACVDLVEQLHHDKGVEDDGVVLSGWGVERGVPATVDVKKLLP